MARRRTTSGEPSEPAKLTVPRERVASEIAARIALGEELRGRDISDEQSLRAARSEYSTWYDFNKELLRRRFTTPEVSEEYTRGPGIYSIPMNPTLRDKIDDFTRDVESSLRRLRSIAERLELYDEPEGATALPSRTASDPRTQIFVVHGRDEGRKEAVARFLERATSLDVVILHERPNRGRTIIEKFEAHAGDAAFAVVILTADDEGRLRGAAVDLSPRGRQNVVWEYGFFCGALGRANVAVLYEDGVELPSDVDGVAYIPLDVSGGWRSLLARELRAAGITVDPTAL